MYRYLALLLMMVAVGCRTSKNIQLVESKHKFNLKSDSAYRHEFNDSITAERSYIVNYDSLGKPSTVKINEVVREVKKGLNQGRVKKDVELLFHEKAYRKAIQHETGSRFSWVFFLILTVFLTVFVKYLHRKCEAIVGQ